MPSVGLSFSPTQSAAYNGPGSNVWQRGGGPMNPVQEAIRILSFRTPSVVGAGAPTPQALMGGPTPLGPRLGNSLSENWLRLLMQGQTPLSAGSGWIDGVPPAQDSGQMGGRFGTQPLPTDGLGMPPTPTMGGPISSMPLPPVGPPSDGDPGGSMTAPRNPVPNFSFGGDPVDPNGPAAPPMPAYNPTMPDDEAAARDRGLRGGDFGGWGMGRGGRGL